MTKISQFLYKKTESNSSLVIESGLTRRQLKAVDLQIIKNSPGYILKESSIEMWSIESTEESESGMCFIGPYIKGRSLSSVKQLDKSIMDRLLRVFRLFEGDEWEFKVVSPESFYLCDNGDILVLPPPLMSFLLGSLPDKDKLKIVNPYTHPSLEGEALYSFFYGVLNYQLLTGELPFSSNSIVELNEKIRRGYFIQPNLYQEELRGPIAKTISRCLKNKKIPNCNKWRDFLDQVKDLPLNDPGKDSSLGEKRESSEKRGRVFLFLRKQAKTISIAAMIVLAVGILLGSILKSVLKPSPTKGLPSIELVETFYNCFDSLDQQLMKACLKSRSVAKKDLKVLAYISVYSKQKKVYFGDSGLLKALEWDREGRPPVEPFVTLFGITNLKIIEISSLEYKVEYLRWTTVHSGDIIIDDISRREDVSIYGTEVKDTVYLERRKESFLISDIKRHEKEVYEEIVVWEE